MKRTDFLTSGTTIVASLSALFLVSGCHSAPAANAFVATQADKATEARLRRPDTMAPIQPFDEGFVVIVDAAQPDAP